MRYGGTERSDAAVATAARAGEAIERVRAWVLSEPMRELLDLVGDATAPTSDSTTWLHLNEELPPWLVDLVESGSADESTPVAAQRDLINEVLAVERRAADAFNFRRGESDRAYVERFQSADVEFDAHVARNIESLAAQLGLVDPVHPQHTTYDKTLVLGGGFRSPLLRAKFAAMLAGDGIDLGDVYFLGSPRPLITDPERPERPVTESYAPGAADEFDLMVAAATSAFPFTAAPVQFLCGCASAASICPWWQHAGDGYEPAELPAEFTHERAAVLIDASGAARGAALSASTSRPPYRPDTSDTFGLWARHAGVAPDQRILIITTQIFVPFQRFDSLRRIYLTYGADVDAAGFGADWGDRPLTPANLLQEALSGIRSARRLLVAAIATLRSDSRDATD